MQRSDVIRLTHMLDAAKEALLFAQGRSRADLDDDKMLVRALVKDIEIIGEAANNVSDECKRQLPHIPWQEIVQMRHRLVHLYFRVNLDIVWSTVREDLPDLVVALERAIPPDTQQ